MEKLRFISSLSLVALLFSSLALADSWPSWRGDLQGSGKAGETSAPTDWGKKSDNIRWRVELPQRGNSTPIVSGDRIFVSQAIDTDKFRGLMCFNRADGSLLWKKGVTYAKPETSHRTNPYCSASPATDGKTVVVSYGSAGVSAYDFEGKELWHRDLGPASHTWGNSSSPVIIGDLVTHYHGPGKGSFLSGLNLKTGETVWKWDEPQWKPGTRTDGFQGRDDEGIIGSFSTPILVNSGERDELVMSFPMEIKAFDPKTGEELWSCGGLNPLVYTSPVVDGETVIATGGYHGNSIGVKIGGNGDVTDTHRLWHTVRHNGGIGTGVAKDGHYYYLNNSNIASCLDMKTGEEKWKARLPGPGKSWGSFTMVGDHIYTLSQPGMTVVFKADPEGLKVVAESDIGEMTNSSLVVSEGEIFLRSHEALWCIGKGK